MCLNLGVVTMSKDAEQYPTIKCSACGCEGVHACLGDPVKQEDLPDGVILIDSGELMKGINSELDKYDISKLSR